MVSDQVSVGGTSQAQEPQPPEAANHQVVVGDIPMEPSCFRPRTGLLRELDRADAQVSVIQAVAGRHGLGATQLAAAYARAKLAAGWRLVAWVNGADTGSLLAGLAAVAEVTGLADGDSGQGGKDAGVAVRDWLETDGDRCLLVFDDVSDPEVVRPFVPVGGTARILITSNRQSTANLGSVVPVDVFSAEEASAFLAGQTGLDDEAGAAAVAAALEYLPLPLALAASVMAASVIAGQHGRYGWYLDRLQAMPVDVSLTGDDGQPYPLSLVRTVLLSLHAVRAADRTGIGVRVMEIMAGLSSAGVHRELLYSAGQAGVLASGGRLVPAALVDRVLEWLVDRSLLTISLDGRTVIMHHLVARVIRSGLARRGRSTAAYESAAFVLDVYSRALAGSQDRRAVRGILQQVTSLLDSLAEPAAEINEELAWVLLRLRFVAFYHALELGDNTPQAIAVGEPLAGDLQRLLGPDHPDTLNSRNSLAAAYLAAGRVAEAIPLFEQILAVRQRMLGPDDPETLISQNNLASAYQDAGRTAEAIRLYQLNLEIRERLLGPDHPSTLTSRSNLATAYRDAEAIPLFEQTLADRERVLGPDHPDTQATRKKLATAYQDVGRATEAIPLLEQTPADRKLVPRSDHPDTKAVRTNPVQAYPAVDRGAAAIPPPAQTLAARKSQPSGGAAGQVLPAGFRRPPAAPARRVLPAGFRRPPAEPARQPLPSGSARPRAKLTDHSSTSSAPEPPLKDAQYEREIVAAITAGDPAGIAMAYDRYAAALYGYCRWMLHDPADAAGALKDTFVIAASTLSGLSEPSKLRPWLFALTRIECRRRIRPTSAARDEEANAVGQPDDAAHERSDADDELSDATVQFRAVGWPVGAAHERSDADDELSDATVQFRAVGWPVGAAHERSDAGDELSDATVQFRAVGWPAGAASERPGVGDELSDATVQFRAVGWPAGAASERPGVGDELSDATVQFRAVGWRAGAGDELSDATVQFQVISQSGDPTTPFRVISQPAHDPGHVRGDQGQAELRSLIHSILAGLRLREREVIELIFRHDLDDDDLTMVLGVSQSRAQALASRARGRLEEALGTLHIALTGRVACPVLGELLADWDGQLTEQTRDLVVWHIEDCQTCAQHGWGAMRPAAFSRLLPLAPLPPDLREQVLSLCTSTADEAVAYRRRVTRHAERIWFARFSRAIGHVSWNGIRANPGVVIAAVTVAAWVVAAVSVTLLTFTGSHAAHAQVTQTSVGTYSRSPAATVTTPASASARPSPTVTQPSARVLTPVRSEPPRVVTTSPAPLRSTSSSPQPSKSSTPSRSASPSASPSHTASASSSASPAN